MAQIVARFLCFSEVGDLPGAPDDQPLYSADGSASWLDPSAVRGTFFGCTWIESVFQ